MSQSHLIECHEHVIQCMKRMASCRPHNKHNLLKLATLKKQNGYPEWQIIQKLSLGQHNPDQQKVSFNSSGQYEVTQRSKARKSTVNLHGDHIEAYYNTLSTEDKTIKQKKIHNIAQKWWRELTEEAHNIIRQNPHLRQADYSRLFGIKQYDENNWTTYSILNKFLELGLVQKDDKTFEVVKGFEYQRLSYDAANYTHRYSMGEAQILDWCIRNNITYQQQVTYKGLKHKKSLYYDYLLSFDDGQELLIEYDGIQHYQYVPYFHKTLDHYHEACLRDQIKNKWAENHEIPLCRIKWDEDIDATLDSYIDENSPE